MENVKSHYQKEWGKYRFIHRLYLTSFFVFVSFFVLFDFFAKMSSREFAGCLFLSSRLRHVFLRRIGNSAIACSEPGCFEYAVELRCFSARDVYERQT